MESAPSPVPRLLASLASLLLAGGIALIWHGWESPNRSSYVTGLVLVALAALLLVVVNLPIVGRVLRLAVGLVVAIGIVGYGVWQPQRMLDKEFAGTGVQWSVPSKQGGLDDRYSSYEFAMLQLGDLVVLANRESARLVSLEDGHQVAELPADRDDEFSEAGGRLLVVREERSAMLYDQSGEEVWPEPITADRAVAASESATLVEAGCDTGETCTARAYGDDGSVLWERRVSDSAATSHRFPVLQRLPADIVSADGTSPVLPRYAAVAGPQAPEPPFRWRFVDPDSGETVHTARADTAGVLGDLLVTITRDRGQMSCTVELYDTELSGSRPERHADCSFDMPWAIGSRLFFETRGGGATVVDLDVPEPDPTGGTLSLQDVRLSPPRAGQRPRALRVSDEGMAWRYGSAVTGYPDVSYRDSWRFTAASEDTSVDVARGAVLVRSSIPRTNPFDPRQGYTPTQRDPPDVDTQVTVLDQDAGEVTGQIRVSVLDSIRPVGQGSALVVADGKVTLIGRAH